MMLATDRMARGMERGMGQGEGQGEGLGEGLGEGTGEGYQDDYIGSAPYPFAHIYTPEPGGKEIPAVPDWIPPGIYALSTGQSVQFGGGSSDALARTLAPVIPAVLNIITGLYAKPAYETVTGPGGSRTTVRIPGTVTGQPAQVAAGISPNTLMMIGVAIAAVVAMTMLGRR